MIRINNHIPDCIILDYDQFHDARGYFSEIYKSSCLPHFKPVQSNYSFSKAGVLRGIHRTPYAKLVTCIHGGIFDVCVDLRENSPTYKKYYSIELSPFDHKSIYIPPYCGHGFLALEDSLVVYHQDQEYNSSVDETYCYSVFDIQWPISWSTEIKQSIKDQNACN